jgi:hypothetical protein
VRELDSRVLRRDGVVDQLKAQLVKYADSIVSARIEEAFDYVQMDDTTPDIDTWAKQWTSERNERKKAGMAVPAATATFTDPKYHHLRYSDDGNCTSMKRKEVEVDVRGSKEEWERFQPGELLVVLEGDGSSQDPFLINRGITLCEQTLRKRLVVGQRKFNIHRCWPSVSTGASEHNRDKQTNH